MPAKRKGRKRTRPKPRRRLGDFSPAPWNPRDISPEALAALAASLRIFGDLSGFVLNERTGTVICGHQRRQALSEVDLSTAKLGKPHKVTLGAAGKRFTSLERTGFAESPAGARFTVRVVDWPEAFDHAANVAANSPELQGDFKPDDLAELLQSLRASDADAYGELFQPLRFDELAASLGISTEAPTDTPPPDPDAAPDRPKRAVTKLGDLYTLPPPHRGKPHRLLCGDATKASDVARLLDGAKADVVFTDPPYNMSFASPALGGMVNDTLDEAAFVRLILASVAQMQKSLRTGGSYYICMSGMEYPSVCHQLRKVDLRARPIVWVKPYIGLGYRHYRAQFEVLLYGFTGGQNARVWTGERKESDVWDFESSLETSVTAREVPSGGMALEVGKGAETVQILLDTRAAGLVVHFDGMTSDVWRFARAKGTYRHPTQKPVALVDRALRNSSHAGDLALDLFAGSGTTLIAAEALGRRACLMELDPGYCDVIVERWEQFTGRKATRIRPKRAQSKARSGRKGGGKRR